MKRYLLRLGIAIFLVGGALVAGILLSADYSEKPDPLALFTVEGAKLTQDHDYFWLEIHLKKLPGEEHNLEIPVRLITGDGQKHMAAKTSFSGNPLDGFTEMWLKFWLEPKDLEGSMKLHLNKGSLVIKSNAASPVLKDGEMVFKNADWERRWLGF